ncbi:MAG TPA: CDP-glycerol glycerophosphotransferase family protein [Spirochaetota bacterium]|nr:CDP-glycerol glycerophosphotransferase family protein [Spirochaetota bacterium]
MLLASTRKIITEFSYFVVSTLRYLKLRNAFSPHGIVAISLIDPCYEHFYEPIVKSLLEDKKYTVISFGNEMMGLPAFSRYTHWVIKEPLLILCVDAELYRKRKSQRRVQMFHGIASFGPVYGDDHLRNYETLFLQSPIMFDQLKEQPYKSIAEEYNVAIYKIGVPKVDDLLDEGPVVKKKEKTIFYGPTYHVKYSSIFKWYKTVLSVAKDLDLNLIIKLHPNLYLKDSYNCSGKIDWVEALQEEADRLGIKFSMFERSIPNARYKEAFIEADLMITDDSGIGREYVLATGKPIIFLDDKIKIPLGANKEDYLQYEEFKIRGRIGPVVLKKADLKQNVIDLLNKNSYKKEIEQYRKSFIYHLGNSYKYMQKAIDTEFAIINGERK